jgi:hypothetical protein
MLRFLSAAVFLTLSFAACFSQIPEDFPVLDKNDLPGAEFSSSRVFTGSSLFGYINGGAELYLEYGFDVAAVTVIDYRGGEYKTEVFKMAGPEEAFGIFSVSKYRCTGMPALSKFTCQTKYQLQICKGPYYISIINKTGTRSDSIVSLGLGKILTDKIKDMEVDLSSYLPEVNTETLQTKSFLAKGRLGIVNGSPEMEEFFMGVNDYTAVIAKMDGKRLISAKFSNRESYQKFLDLHKWKDDMSGTNGTVKKISERHLIIEFPD